MPLYKDAVRMPSEQLKKITKSVVFELTGQYRAPKGRVKDHLGKNREQVAKQVTIPSTFTIFEQDRGDVVQYQYANSVQGKEVGGKMTNVYSPHKLFFHAGKMVVKPEQPDLYTFLMLNPSLVGNGGKPKFKKIDLSQEATTELAREQAIYEAKKIILDKEQGWAYDKLVRIAVNLGANVNDMDENMVKNFLMSSAKKDPVKFREVCYSPFGDMKYLITQNKNQAFITFNDNTREWLWAEKMGTNNGMLIANTPPGMDPISWFMDFVSREKNATLLEELKKNVGFSNGLNAKVIAPLIVEPEIKNGKVITSEYKELEAEYVNIIGSRKGIGIYNTVEKLKNKVQKLKAEVPA